MLTATLQIGAQFVVTERAVRALAGSSEMLRWLENAQATFDDGAMELSSARGYDVDHCCTEEGVTPRRSCLPWVFERVWQVSQCVSE